MCKNNIIKKLKMKTEHIEILQIITAYLEKHSQLRFTQAIFNLDINQPPDAPEYKFKGLLRDNHGDKDDEVLKRIKTRLDSLNN
jgi:hypothetical protein